MAISVITILRIFATIYPAIILAEELPTLSRKLDPDSLKQLDMGLRKAFGFTDPQFKARKRRSPETSVVPQFMVDLANQETTHHRDLEPNDDFTFYGNIRSYHPLNYDIEEVATSHQRHLKYNLETFPPDEVLQKAELKLFTEAVDPFGNASHVTVHVYEILSNTNEDKVIKCDDSKEKKKLIESRKLLTESEAKWNSFDVTESIKSWMATPSELRCGFLINIEPLHSSNEIHSFEHIKLKMSKYNLESVQEWMRLYEPVLVLKSRDQTQMNELCRHKSKEVGPSSRISDQKQLRRRRNVIQGSFDQSEKARKLESIRSQLCNRYLFYIDFSQIRWDDWILAPPGFQAYICIGSCPFPLAHHVNSTNHAIVQTVVNSFRPHVVGPSRCIPTELSSISLLFLDQNNSPVLKSYKDMVVQACGCR